MILTIALRFYRADVNVICNLKRAYRISQKSGKYVDCSELNISSLYSYALKISNSQRPKLVGLSVSCLTVPHLLPSAYFFVYSYKRRLHTGLVSSLQSRISVCIPLEAPICEMRHIRRPSRLTHRILSGHRCRPRQGPACARCMCRTCRSDAGRLCSRSKSCRNPRQVSFLSPLSEPW